MKRICILLLLLCGFSLNAFSEGKWTQYKTGFISEFHPEWVSSLAIERDSIWCGTAHGLVKRNRRDGTFITYTSNDGLIANNISAIAIDHDGVKWIGNGENGISSFDNTIFTTYSKSNIPQLAEIDSLYNHKWNFSITDIVVDPDNTVLFSSSGSYFTANSGFPTYHSELFIYDNNTWKINAIWGNSGSPFYLAVDTAYPDTVWFCKDGPGVGYFVKPNYTEKSDSRFSFFGGHAIAMDRNNFVWYGSSSQIYEFDRRTFTHFPSETTGIVSGISDITVDKNNVKWFGSSMGITRYDGNTWKTYAPDDGIMKMILPIRIS